MISNQILQKAVEGLKQITKCDMSIVEKDGKIVASTEDNMLEKILTPAKDFVESAAESQLVQGYHFFKTYDNGLPEYIVWVKGEDEDSYKIGKLASFHIQSLLVAYKERYDKDNFIKNLLLDNLLLVDIYNKAKKLHIENNIKRVVFLIETKIDKEMSILETVRSLFSSKLKDFITVVDENNIILVKELREGDHELEMLEIAKTITDALVEDPEDKVYVANGTVIDDLKDVSRSYKEAKMSLEVGKVFEPQRLIINYGNLGIGRLIYQLPLPLCRMFIKEVLDGLTVDDFDDDSLATVNKFFENNLNVSETSRQLYIHRNTLVYRLDKLLKMTGLDLRKFDDAIIFKITLMVSQYMNYMESMSY